MTPADGGPTAERPVAVVTGAARGMGAATARRLAARGWTVALVDLGADAEPLPAPYRPSVPDDLARAAAACGDHGDAHHADVRDPAALAAVVDDVVAHHGRLDAAVAAAGAVAGGPPLWETTDEVWRAMVEVNLGGVFHLVRAAVPHLLARPEPRRGRFVAVASAAAHHGLPQLAAYSAAKHGVVGAVRALAAELGPTGVTANVVAPGSTDSAMLEASAAVYGLDDPAAFGDQTRIGRLLDPDEVGATVEWLCVDAPGGLTGAVIDVDGGFRA